MKKVMFKISLLCLVLLIVFVIVSSVCIVGAGEGVIITEFGKVISWYKDPGLYLKFPYPIQVVQRFDRRMQFFKTEFIQMTTKDEKNIAAQMYVCWDIDNLLKFFQAVIEPKRAVIKVKDLVNSQMGAALGRHTMQQLFSIKAEDIKIEEIETLIKNNTNKKSKEDYGIGILRLGFTRLSFPKSNTESVYRRMNAERKREANRYRSEGTKQAAMIDAETLLQSSKIKSDAQEKAEITLGEGERKAAEIYNQAAQKDPEFFKFRRMMEFYKQTLGERSVLVFTSDSELFKYLTPKKETLPIQPPTPRMEKSTEQTGEPKEAIGKPGEKHEQ